MNRQDILEHHKTSMSFLVRRRTGFTDKLYRKADRSTAGKFSTTAFVEGPYGKYFGVRGFFAFQAANMSLQVAKILVLTVP